MVEGLVVVTLVAGGFFALTRARGSAVHRRRQQMSKREPCTDRDWVFADANAADDKIIAVLNVFADDLGVEWNCLHPTDRFDGILSLKGAFLIDEDVSDDLSNAANDAFGEVNWDSSWETMADAVVGVARQLPA